MNRFKNSIHRRKASLQPQQPKPGVLESSWLGELSPELILDIASFLPPESAASFSLCCRPIGFILGTKCLNALEAEDDPSDSRYKFLTLLERDLPNHILCYYCEKFHAIDKAQRHARSVRLRSISANNYLPCWKADDANTLYHCFHKEFSSTIFQMTMKRYRQGLDYSMFLGLLSYKDSCLDFPEVSTASVRIAEDDSLLMRVQSIWIVPKPTPLEKIPYIIMCPHIKSDLVSMDNPDGITIQWQYCMGQKKLENGEGIIPCGYCLTEFRVDIQPIGEKGIAIVYTKWQDLGEGRSHLDEKWRSHLGPMHSAAANRKLVPVDFAKGSICTRFEGKMDHLFEYESVFGPSSWRVLRAQQHLTPVK